MKRITKIWRVEQVKQILFESEDNMKSLPQWLEHINKYTPSQFSIRSTRELAQIFKTINIHGELELLKRHSQSNVYYTVKDRYSTTGGIEENGNIRNIETI